MRNRSREFLISDLSNGLRAGSWTGFTYMKRSQCVAGIRTRMHRTSKLASKDGHKQEQECTNVLIFDLAAFGLYLLM